MKNIIVTLLIGLYLLSFACTKPNMDISEQKNSNATKQNTLYKGNTKYMLFFEKTDYYAGISSLQSSPLSEHKIHAKIPDDLSRLKNSNAAYSIYANGIEINTDLKTNSCDLKAGLYGKNVSFVFKDKKLKSGDTDSISLYIPELVNISSPPVVQPKDLLPLCYYDNFIIKWNEDAQNENGLLVNVEWSGEMYGDKDQNSFVRNLDIIPEDDGEAVLNKELFKDIPDFAIIHIMLLRGNIDTTRINNDLFKVFGESHTNLSIVLVKDLEHYNSLLE